MKHIFLSFRHLKSLFIVMAMTLPSLANAAIYIEFNNGAIAGSSTNPQYKNWSDVTSYSWGITANTNFSQGAGAEIGKPIPSPFAWSQAQDATFVPLFIAEIQGTHLQDIKVDFTNGSPNGKSAPLFQMDFSTAFVTSLSSSSAGSNLTENAAFVYQKLKISYTSILPNGSPGNTISATWDVSTETVSNQFALVYGTALAAGFIPSAVPEPSEYLLLLAGLGLMGLVANRRRKQ